jgi:hypothetical protein
MMKTTTSISLLALASYAAPAAADPFRATASSAVKSPAPFFGESMSPQYAAGDLVSLWLTPDAAPKITPHTAPEGPGETGTYTRRHCYVTPCYDALPEQGTYELSTTHTGIHYLRFYGTDQDFGTILIDRYEWSVDSAGVVWLRKVGGERWIGLQQFPDESLCDQSAGQWRDDDVNPTTGLYCDCASTNYWNPASGGCVARP